MKEIIRERTGCSEKRAAIIENRLQGISPELEPVLEEWLKMGKEDNSRMYEGFSVNSLMSEYGMGFTGALLTVDWLIRDPKAAKAALKEGIK